MRPLALLLLSLSLSSSHSIAPLRNPSDPSISQHARRGGRWYLAQNGHAVYCYGPVMTIRGNDGGPQRVATFCTGDRRMVPLKD
jgi:hypothetical protein